MAVEEQPVDPIVAAALRRARERGETFDPNKEVKPIPVDYDPKEASPADACSSRAPAGVSGGPGAQGVGAKVTCRF